MCKNFYFILVAIFAATFMTSCGGGKTEGPTSEVLSEKIYNKVKEAYDDVSGHFYEGTCVVQKNKKYGVINTEGEEIIPCEYDEIKDCSEGMFVYGMANENVWDKDYGFLDKAGNIILKAEYEHVRDFQDGVAVIKDVDKNYKSHYAVANKEGKFVVGFDVYKEIRPFGNGLAAVQTGKEHDHNFGYINTNGEMVLEPIYDNAYQFCENFAKVRLENGTWVIINTEGEVIYTPEKGVEYLSDEFSDGRLPIKKAGKCGYINTEGEIAIPLEYDEAYVFSDGTAHVVKGKMMMLINTDGKVLEEQKLGTMEELMEDAFGF